jgi:hypothetical protein
MDRTELTAIATATADQLVTITFTDGTTRTVVSEGRMNSKGFLFRMGAEDGLEYVAPTKVASIVVVTDTTPNAPADMFTEDEYTAASLAAVLDMAAKDLRVALRSMDLNVGKGKRYAFTADQARTIAANLADNA